MADHRSKRDKLRAVIAPGSGASEGERRNARVLLARLEKARPRVRIENTDTLGWEGVRWSVRTDPDQAANAHPLRPEDILRASEDLLRRAERMRRHGPPGGFPGATFEPGSSNGTRPPRRPVSNRPKEKRRSGAVVGELRFDDEPWELPDSDT
jgi:hypothetical protein